MGRYNSSLTRVAPVFDQLMDRDSSGESWIGRLLKLPRFGLGRVDHNQTYRLIPGPEGTTYGWGRFEKALDPPQSLLRWLVQNIVRPEDDSALGDGATRQKRETLIQRDPNVISEALQLLEHQPKARAWYVLEGQSRPDVYLETEQAIIVIEGKRTESGPTTHTAWMPGRHQMLRHLDCAWEIRDGRDVFGFFIVEGLSSGEIPPRWVAYAHQTVSDKALAQSLPHRSPQETEALRRCFLGITTWQMVCEELILDWDSLPDRADIG